MTEHGRNIGPMVVDLHDNKKLGWSEIAKKLNAQGHRTAQKSRWLPQNVGRVYHSAKAALRKGPSVLARGPAGKKATAKEKAAPATNGHQPSSKLDKVVSEFFSKLGTMGLDVSRIERRGGKVEVTYSKTMTETASVHLGS